MNSCELWKLCHNYYDKKERKLKKDQPMEKRD